MAKGGKLTKLKSVLKKWNSFSKQNNRRSLNSVVSAADEDYSTDGIISRDLRHVYMGKSRRCYLVASDVVNHPFLKKMADRSDHDTINIACKVVLFEHLLWMLENVDPQLELMDELVEFYAR
ncbi:hypothetical protein C1H46_031067 [Malus baccata]|uniref:Uncharacterized protein n=1 Tax=Malus baccata TaxID=106549 RepID=A0A540LA53_MALBA|nr:hypothetical protein C1H46_031067 [Malus baccata]